MSAPRDALRVRCRQLGIEPSFRHPGGRSWLGSDEMQQVIRRLELKQANVSKLVGDLPAPDALHMFWAPPSGPLTAKCNLPSYAVLGVTSAVKAGYKVRMWSYSSEIGGLPLGVSVQSAAELVPLADAERLREKGLRIQHLSDLVRLHAVRHHAETSSEGSWLVDVDVMWLRKLESIPSASGHVFASMHSRADALMWKTEVEKLKYWKVSWLRSPDEQCWLGCPWAFPKGSKLLASALREVARVFGPEKPNNLHYNCLVRAVHNLIQEEGLQIDVVDPWVFHTLPHFVGKAPWNDKVVTTCRGVQLSPFEDVQKHCIAVSQSWISSHFKTGGEPSSALVSTQKLQTNCLYAKVAACIGIRPCDDGDTLDAWIGRVCGDVTQMTSTPCTSLGRSDAQTADTPRVAIGPARRRVRRKSLVASPAASGPAAIVPVAQLPASRASGPAAIEPVAQLPAGRASIWFQALAPWLDFGDVMALCAVCFSAVRGETWVWIRIGYAVERCLRSRMSFLRDHSDLPTALSTVSSAMRFWRYVVAACARLALDHVPNNFALHVKRTDWAMIADAALYHGALNSPLVKSHSGFAHVILALAQSDDPAKFHFTLGAMINLSMK